MNGVEASREIKAVAERVGFSAAGICRLGPIERAGAYRAWVGQGRHGSMGYLARHADLREDPRGVLDGAVSAVVVAESHYQPGRGAVDGRDGSRGAVAMYAWGRDYHVVLKTKLRRLVGLMGERLGASFDSRVCVDTVPILEKELAVAAGVGWMGKHTLVVHPKLGSFVSLGVLLTTLDLEPDEPMADRCGSCRRCLDACPTGALDGPRAMDARRCISYLTIEHRDAIDVALRRRMGNWVFGCDACQRVCPWNREAPVATEPAFAPGPAAEGFDLAEMAGWTEAAYREATGGTAMDRASLSMLRRNAAIALGNGEVDASVEG